MKKFLYAWIALGCIFTAGQAFACSAHAHHAGSHHETHRTRKTANVSHHTDAKKDKTHTAALRTQSDSTHSDSTTTQPSPH